jgi:hypothetical protein
MSYSFVQDQMIEKGETVPESFSRHFMWVHARSKDVIEKVAVATTGKGKARKKIEEKVVRRPTHPPTIAVATRIVSNSIGMFNSKLFLY